jgi:hypothetical protein
MNGDAPFVTDEGNYILDLHLQRIGNARQMSLVLNQIPGVVENGLFIDICDVGDRGTAMAGRGARHQRHPEEERIDILESDNLFNDLTDAEAGMAFDYDLFVIGGGSGGVRAARVAAGDRRQGGAGRGKPHGRHLRDPRLRAEEADGLRLGFPEACDEAALWLGHPARRASTGRRSAPGCMASSSGWKGSTAPICSTARASRSSTCARRWRMPIPWRSPTAPTKTAKHILIATGGRPFLPDDARDRACDHLERGVPPRRACPSAC